MNENTTNINCEKPININTQSNHWKYSIFIIEIFTYLIKWGDNNEYYFR